VRILYVDIDTLRADHLGCYGYARRTSPNLDALAAGSVRFTNVYASDVPCLPSRTAWITGRFGIHTGVVNHGGRGADLRPEGPARGFFSRLAVHSFAARFYREGFRTASFSSFPFRHSAHWWTMGFQETSNPSRGMGNERAHDVAPAVLDWLDRHGREERWLCHVHFWDPHTPYNTPEDYGNPFASDPIPGWYTEEIRARDWERPGPHSAQEPWGFAPDEWGTPPPRQPWNLADMDAVKRMFDGYDTGIRYADDHVGQLLSKLADLGVLDDTVILISSDHGEAFGELGVYADHQAADQPTARLPVLLRFPGLPARVDRALHFHLDVAATLVELCELGVPRHWDGRSFARSLRAGVDLGRPWLVTSQGAWSCQRGVRFGDHLYLHTWHDGYHDWPERMLFDVASDPHELRDLATEQPERLAEGARLLDGWVAEQLALVPDRVDPLLLALEEGGPFHCRGHLPRYLERLRATGRKDWADRIAARHPREAGGA
jgi:arylsulfatase A-like enzyme